MYPITPKVFFHLFGVMDPMFYKVYSLFIVINKIHPNDLTTYFGFFNCQINNKIPFFKISSVTNPIRMPIIPHLLRVCGETECVVAFQCTRNAKILLRVANRNPKRMWQGTECGHGHGTRHRGQWTVGNMCKCACVIIETS